ncbi:MAG: DUF4349 domain-containing protein [Propionibacteriales bacterium]|nr:DUF4349 domain-containing protein [Propionibacteriales bacterium]
MKLVRTALAVPALVLVAACGASSDTTSVADSAPAEGAPVAPGAPPDVSPQTAPDDGALRDLAGLAPGQTGSFAGAPSDVAKAPVTQTRAVISRGQVSLESDDLDSTRFALQKLLDGWRGSITSEESSADDEGRTDQQRLELRVPSRDFGAAMDAISGLGTLVDRSRTSEDVTTQVIDNAARVRSQKLSLARVQALLARAKDLNQIIAIESQLSQRQADLDSLEQQQQYLADQTAESTIDVYLRLPEKRAGAKDDDPDDGFVGGLQDGWDALTDTTTGLLRGLGAALPFGAALALLGLPVALLWRRRRALT